MTSQCHVIMPIGVKMLLFLLLTRNSFSCSFDAVWSCVNLSPRPFLLEGPKSEGVDWYTGGTIGQRAERNVFNIEITGRWLFFVYTFFKFHKSQGTKFLCLKKSRGAEFFSLKNHGAHSLLALKNHGVETFFWPLKIPFDRPRFR